MIKFTRDSAAGRAVATAKQVLIAFVGALPVLLAFVSDPEIGKIIKDYYPKLVPVVTILSAVATFVVNYRRKDVPNK